MFLSLVIAIWAAFDTTATIVALAIATLAIPFIVQSLTSRIGVDQNELRIDQAHIELKYLGKVTVLDSDAMRLLRTRDADPAAFLAIKFWAAKGIKIEVTDPRDATPYWLITSKRGEKLAALLTKS
ncbi:unannotated protein [freshwater metagenome]|uniref:Unannotated protein n=1 Tax=freshwater metagenome TaxID=449393 RepID=A0A6J7N1V3_9ZZZZ